MKRNPLIALFVTNVIVLAVGNGLLPLLPVLAVGLGATPHMTGLYLGSVSASITFGALLPGWLPGPRARRRLLIMGSSIGVPALLLLSRATALWQVIPLTCILWWSGGICLALSSVYTGLLSRASARGRTFSLVAMSTPCGLLAGGLLVGWLVDSAGLGATFTALAALWALLPYIFAQAVPDLPPPAPTGSAAQATRTSPPWALLLLGGALLSAASISISQLSASLAMQALVFTPAAIASTTSAAGLAMIPVVLLLSLAADRMGRRGLLIAGYLLTATGAVALAGATALWHFWVALGLLRVGQAVNDSMAPALATDLLPAAALGRYLPRLKATNWIAGMVSFGAAGYAIGRLGTGPVFLFAGAAAIVAATVLALLPASRRALLQGEPSL